MHCFVCSNCPPTNFQPTSKYNGNCMQRIFRALLVPTYPVKAEDLIFCSRCEPLMDQVLEKCRKIAALELEIEAKAHEIGRIMVDGCAVPNDLNIKSSIVWKKFKQPVIQNFVLGKLPNPAVRLEIDSKVESYHKRKNALEKMIEREKDDERLLKRTGNQEEEGIGAVQIDSDDDLFYPIPPSSIKKSEPIRSKQAIKTDTDRKRGRTRKSEVKSDDICPDDEPKNKRKKTFLKIKLPLGKKIKEETASDSGKPMKSNSSSNKTSQVTAQTVDMVIPREISGNLTTPTPTLPRSNSNLSTKTTSIEVPDEERSLKPTAEDQVHGIHFLGCPLCNVKFLIKRPQSPFFKKNRHNSFNCLINHYVNLHLNMAAKVSVSNHAFKCKMCLFYVKLTVKEVAKASQDVKSGAAMIRHFLLNHHSFKRIFEESYDSSVYGSNKEILAQVDEAADKVPVSSTTTAPVVEMVEPPAPKVFHNEEHEKAILNKGATGKKPGPKSKIMSKPKTLTMALIEPCPPSPKKEAEESIGKRTRARTSGSQTAEIKHSEELVPNVVTKLHYTLRGRKLSDSAQRAIQLRDVLSSPTPSSTVSSSPPNETRVLRTATAAEKMKVEQKARKPGPKSKRKERVSIVRTSDAPTTAPVVATNSSSTPALESSRSPSNESQVLPTEKTTEKIQVDQKTRKSTKPGPKSKTKDCSGEEKEFPSCRSASIIRTSEIINTTPAAVTNSDNGDANSVIGPPMSSALTALVKLIKTEWNNNSVPEDPLDEDDSFLDDDYETKAKSYYEKLLSNDGLVKEEAVFQEIPPDPCLEISRDPFSDIETTSIDPIEVEPQTLPVPPVPYNSNTVVSFNLNSVQLAAFSLKLKPTSTDKETGCKGEHVFYCPNCNIPWYDGYEPFLEHFWEHKSNYEKKIASEAEIGLDLPRDVREALIRNGRSPKSFHFSDHFLCEMTISGQFNKTVNNGQTVAKDEPMGNLYLTVQGANGKIFKCRRCDYNVDALGSNSMREVIMHYLKEHYTRNFICNICGQGFSEEGYLKRHFPIYHKTLYVPS